MSLVREIKKTRKNPIVWKYSPQVERIQNNCKRESRETPGCLGKMFIGEGSLSLPTIGEFTMNCSELEWHSWKSKTLKQNRTLHSGNDPKHISKSTNRETESLRTAESRPRPKNSWDILSYSLHNDPKIQTSANFCRSKSHIFVQKLVLRMLNVFSD